MLGRRQFLLGLGGFAAATAATPALGVASSSSKAPTAMGVPVRQWAMLIDLRRCDGCVGLGLPPQCTQACIWARYVPEEQQWLEVFDQTASELPGAPRQFVPLPCVQCENAPCVNVCPVGATFHTAEGVVLIDQERCIGCRLCMAACPYDRRFFNWDDPVQPDFVAEAPYNPETQVPAMRGTVMKCDFCADMTREGGLPWCVTGCPRGAIYIGDLEEDVATNGADTVQFSQLILEQGAFRPKEDLGTSPRLFYIEGHGQLSDSESNEGHGHLSDSESNEGHGELSDSESNEGHGELSDSESDEGHLLADRLEWPWARAALAQRAEAGRG